MNLFLYRHSTASFGNIRGNGNYRSMKLVRKTISLLRWKLFHKFIYTCNKFASFLPRIKLLKLKLKISHDFKFLLAKILINP